MEVDVISQGGGLSVPDIQAHNETLGNLRYLNVRYNVERRGQYSQTFLVLRAEVRMDSFPQSLFCSIIQEGFFNKRFRGENLEIGVPYIDDSLLINVNPLQNAENFFSLNDQLLPLLAKKSDLRQCQISSESNNLVTIYLETKKTNIKSLKESFKILQSLIPVTKLKKEHYKFPVVKPADEVISFIPASTEGERDYEAEEVQKIPATVDIGKVLDKLRTRVNKLDLSENQAEMTHNSGLFNTITWKWDKDKIIVKAVGTVRNAVKLKVEMKPVSVGTSNEFSWFKPYDTIELMVEPLLLQDDVLHAYDIAKNFNRIKTDKILTKLEFIAEDNDAVLEIKADAHPDNVRQIFELISLFSWEWLTNFVLA